MSGNDPISTRPRVICVDDDQRVLSALKRVLRNEPYEVMTTHSPAEALRWLEEGTPSMLITDLRMPGINGEDLMREVRERHPRAARLMLTAYPEVVSALLRDAGEVMAKPWNDEGLRTHVWERLRSREGEGAEDDPIAESDGSSLLADVARALESGRIVPGNPPGPERRGGTHGDSGR